MAATASLTALAQRIPSATLRLGSADAMQAGQEVSVNTVKFRQNVLKILHFPYTHLSRASLVDF